MNNTKNFLFYLECVNNHVIEDYVVCYEALRVGDILREPYINVFWKKRSDNEKIEHMSKTYKDLFFGVSIIKEGIRYKMRMKSFPDKCVTLHLKKSGAVVAKTSISGKEAKIEYIRIYVQKNFLGFPKITSCTVYGVHKKLNIQEHIRFTDKQVASFNFSNIATNLKNVIR